MNIREQVFYGRQSVDKKDSISIESQFEFCQYELRGEHCKKFTDKGYSGKNMDRPQFQAMIREIEQGLISKVIVYKLDRISRSIIDFAGMMTLFAKYNVEFVSATEKFDTSTPMGRAMLNICIVFAQLERESIQQRVTDAYYSRCQKGFHMGGKTPYGFKLEPTTVDGIKTKMMVADPVAAEHVKLMYEMYADPQTSLGDIARHFAAEGIGIDGQGLQRVTLSNLLRNPVYAQADLDLYEFFIAQGASIANDAADFAGINGCYLYRGRSVSESKINSLKDQILVIAPHEGIVPAELWLTVRKKLIGNVSVGGISKKAKNTWLSGKVKCGRCGAGLMYCQNQYKFSYFRCRKRADRKSCEGCGTLRVHEVEESVYGQMCRKMTEFKTLKAGGSAKANPKLTALKVELAQVETAIEKLLDTLMDANKTLVAYANSRIEELDARRQSLTKKIADMSMGAVSSEQIIQISGLLDNWDSISFEDRRLVVDGMISSIHATSENISINWKI
jgi:DNA invertase Pin-like site-specific DNA recombinase